MRRAGTAAKHVPSAEVVPPKARPASNEPYLSRTMASTSCRAIASRKARVAVALSAFLPGEALHHARDDAVAALAGEAERVLAREIDLRGEALAQEAARAKEPRAHRRLRNL